MKTNRMRISLFLVALLSGCTTNTFKLDGNTYSGGDQFQLATDSLVRETEEQLVKELHVQTPLSSKRLLVGVPSLEAVKATYHIEIMRGNIPAQTDLRDNLAVSNYKQFQMVSRVMKRIGVYAEVSSVETTGVRLQPSSTETVLYLYISPDQTAAQWYIDGVKQGVQTVNIDNGQPKYVGKMRSFFNSIKAYAIGD